MNWSYLTHLSHRSSHALALLLCLAPVATGCLSENNKGTTESPCPDGTRELTIDGKIACFLLVTQANLPIIETGFDCPPDMHLYTGDGWLICAEQPTLDVADIVNVLEDVGAPELPPAIQTLDGQPYTIAATTECGPPKVDILLVMDNSSSMVREQVDIGAAFDEVGVPLLEGMGADIRIAATTMDAQCDPNNPDIAAAGGRFSTRSATRQPPSAYVSVTHECYKDEDCSELGAGAWRCRPAHGSLCNVSPNGTINSSCAYRCTADSECQQRLSDPRAICLEPSTNPADWGCVVPYDDSGCPAELPEVFTHTNLAYFHCAANVGVNQLKCYKYEQGLNAAWMALDPDGPNPGQNPALIRDDALLVVLFVSNEDDCSTADGVSIAEDDYDTCTLLGTTDEGGPMEPITTFVDRFRSLKMNPETVIVAAAVGDALGADEAAREAYLASIGAPQKCYAVTSICHDGWFQWGRRYQQLVSAFGERGVGVNMCGESTYEKLFQNLATTIQKTHEATCSN